MSEIARLDSPEKKEETTVGNYFVSNYPPYSVWSERDVPNAFQALANTSGTDAALGIYLHIPFCRKRCHFCYFRVYTDKDSKQIGSYLDAAIRELSLYAQQPLIAGRKPKFIYFGGGTPSYLSHRQLQELTDRMKAILPWDKAEEVAFECEPGTLTETKLSAIRELGVTRLSLGIENFDDKILEINGRAHRSKEIWRAYDFARSLDFSQINIDLIAGMIGETEENWKACIERVIQLAPDSITIYQMEIPYNTTIYKEMREKHKDIAPVADWPTKRRWVSEAFDRLVASGYSISSAYTAVKEPSRTKFVYRDELWAGADMLGLGVASFGHLGGTHVQNQHHWDPYLAALEAGNLPITRALTPTKEERFIREWILQLKLGRIAADYFRKKFGYDPLIYFSDYLQRLQSDGFLAIEGDSVRLNREGLLQVDRLLQGFFLPQHRNIRYA